jgi:hypothetical protein
LHKVFAIKPDNGKPSAFILKPTADPQLQTRQQQQQQQQSSQFRQQQDMISNRSRSKTLVRPPVVQFIAPTTAKLQLQQQGSQHQLQVGGLRRSVSDESVSRQQQLWSPGSTAANAPMSPAAPETPLLPLPGQTNSTAATSQLLMNVNTKMMHAAGTGNSAGFKGLVMGPPMRPRPASFRIVRDAAVERDLLSSTQASLPVGQCQQQPSSSLESRDTPVDCDAIVDERGLSTRWRAPSFNSMLPQHNQEGDSYSNAISIDNTLTMAAITLQVTDSPLRHPLKQLSRGAKTEQLEDRSNISNDEDDNDSDADAASESDSSASTADTDFACDASTIPASTPARVPLQASISISASVSTIASAVTLEKRRDDAANTNGRVFERCESADFEAEKSLSAIQANDQQVIDKPMLMSQLPISSPTSSMHHIVNISAMLEKLSGFGLLERSMLTSSPPSSTTTTTGTAADSMGLVVAQDAELVPLKERMATYLQWGRAHAAGG